LHHDKDKLKQTIFLIALFALGGFLFVLLKGFLSPFLGSLVFYILLRQPFFYLTERAKRKWNKGLAVMLLLLISFLVLVLPVLLVSLMLSSKISYLINHYQDLLHIGQEWSAKAKDYLGVDVLTADTVNKMTGFAADVLPGFISATADALFNIFVLYFLLYFMLANARYIEGQVRHFLPFKEDNNRLLLHELQIQTISNSIGIAILAILQGLVAGLGYWIFGVDEPWFWAVLTGVASVIPVVGTGLVWVPISIFLYASGKQFAGIALLVYCAAVMVTVVENVFRFVVIKKLGDVHPLITFFGVIMGISLFGFLGIIFGPLLISYFILLLRIYRNEYVVDEG